MPRSRMQVSIPNDILIPEVGRLLEGGSEVVLKTKGSSMLPAIIGERDSVRLRKTSFYDVQKGDIILAEIGEGHFVLHRVIDKRNDCLVLRGDGNIIGTEICRPENILGIVTEIITPSGRERKPGKARLWRALGPFTRRCVLAIYRRTILKLI